LKVPEAVTDTSTTQWPEAQTPAPTPVQAAAATVPLLSHPQETEELTLRLLTFCPLLLKSLSADVVMPAVSTD
jgi:hypothetical protein